ncbi:flippase [Clostridium beijerinckii]|uniref:flippase n=1 Tax=Clostridium beijerinckii TaxID=1520 RepID=UPI000809E3F4|nr:flippase [Clostridium beijerinckii]OCA99777.1 hypothetical protein BGS1_17160 [Clostridium beijerinckii]
MKEKSSIKLNFIYSVIYQMLLIILPLITSPYISRTLGSAGFGVYSYTYSVANCFGLVGMLGITNYGNRTIAAVQENRNQRSKVFWNIWALQVMMSTIVFIFYWVYVIAFCVEEYRLVSYIQIIAVLCSMVDINWFFFGMEKFKLTVIRNVIIKLISVILIFTFVKSSSDVWLYALIIVGGLFVTNLAIWPFLRDEVDFVKPVFKEMCSHFAPIVVLFIPVIAVSLYKLMDKVLLGMLSSMNQAGFYENTEKIINIPMGLITALGTVMLPRMSYLFANGERKETERYIFISIEFVFFMASAFAFGIAGVANEFAPIFFGEEFIEVGNLIMVISPTVIFVSLANVIRTQYLIPLHYDKAYIISVWVGAIVNLIINVTLIPQMGAMGAVVGTVLAEASVMGYQTWYIRKEIKIREYAFRGWYYIFAGAIMFIVVRFIADCGGINIITIVKEVLGGGAVYIGLCLPYVCIIHRSELKSVLHKKSLF